MATQGNWVRVWDPLVRIAHWVLVTGFLAAYLSAEHFAMLHERAGYLVCGVVAWRALWGLVGSEHARFKNFVRPPNAIVTHLRGMVTGRVEAHVGHNPAAGAMIVAMLVCLSATGVSGFMLAEAGDGKPPAAIQTSHLGETLIANAAGHAEDDDISEARRSAGVWEEIHEFFANLCLLLVVLHILGVAVSSFLEDENLALAMITGRKRRRAGRN